MPKRKAADDPVPPNAYGIEPPVAYSVPMGPQLPRIAVPSKDTKGSHLNALLVRTQDFHVAISMIILGSETLKAWFAYRLCNPGGVGTKWAEIETFLVDSDSSLPKEYQEQNNDFEIQNVGLDDLKSPEFRAQAVFTLMRRIQANPTGTLKRGKRLRYHPYYQTQLHKCFLAYRFLMFITYYTSKSRSFSIFRPIAQNKIRAWERSPQGKVGVACEMLIEGKLQFFYRIVLCPSDCE